MTRVQLIVRTESSARDEVATSLLRDDLAGLEDITVGGSTTGPLQDETLIERLSGLEVLATFVTSAAAYQLAAAIRDFVKRQRLAIELRTADGRELTITAQGDNVPAVADLVGFMSGKHTKESTTVTDRRGRPKERKD